VQESAEGGKEDQEGMRGCVVRMNCVLDEFL
jgi:hypothetical protein